MQGEQPEPSAPADLIRLITTEEPALRDMGIVTACRSMDAAELGRQCARLDGFWRSSDNLYHRVRALLFLHALYRYELPAHRPHAPAAPLPRAGVQQLFGRRFEAAIDVFLDEQSRGVSAGVTSGLAQAYRELAFQTLADQVRASVRAAEGNGWMFALPEVEAMGLRIRDELRVKRNGRWPLLRERTPVRMDISHSGWSDIFFLGMDHPRGARVLNVSIDLGVRGRDLVPQPPIECTLQLIDEPVLRLESLDLEASCDLEDVAAVFDFGADYLGLLKAAVVASGLVAPALEGSGQPLAPVLERLVGPGRGLALRSHVRGIPKGSRLAVSTNLLGSLIALCMRATGQIDALEGGLREQDRRHVAARAILGEWLGGSGGGWQDSGGLWPGTKLIEGVEAAPGDPEYGVSRGRLLPRHTVLDRTVVSDAARVALQQSLVLVHGGMAQNVGPILEIVTEKYLLRSEEEWRARAQAGEIFDALLSALAAGDIRSLARETTRNFFGPICSIIPWATNAFTEALVERTRAEFGDRYWGFWMLGGMSGGGMGLLFDPSVRDHAADRLGPLMAELEGELGDALPFAMTPVVYDFDFNEDGSVAECVDGLIDGTEASTASARAAPIALREADLESDLDAVLRDEGFDLDFHEEIRSDLLRGRIGLEANRLAPGVSIEDARHDDVRHADAISDQHRTAGERALNEGSVAIVTLSAGLGSRWTQGAGVVKAINPFVQLAGAHRSFVDVHLAKSRRRARLHGTAPAQIFTTSRLSHAAIARRLDAARSTHPGLVLTSRGRKIGLRFVPTERDLRFAWREGWQQTLDERAEKMRSSTQAALIAWARDAGEASDYRDNLPSQCLHPVGHWYEVPNLLVNGTLATLIEAQPALQTLLVHNVDTLGADVDPGWLGLHLAQGLPLGFEVVPRQVEDRGGGLARVDGRLRLIESLALPLDDDELRLSYYSTMTTWVDVDGLLALFGLTRTDLSDSPRVEEAVHAVARRMPSYGALREVKRRWGHGQEDVFPVLQFEKLWGDMSALPELACHYFAVSRQRGQQLKDPAQLDGWLRDGSAAYVDSLCDWSEA